MRTIHGLWATILATAYFAAAFTAFGADMPARQKGYDITKTGLMPRYPSHQSCSPLTSLYASWDAVVARDARNRIPASMADASAIRILSPASGHVVALWRANWGWGEEQALLVEHTKKELKSAAGKT